MGVIGFYKISTFLLNLLLFSIAFHDPIDVILYSDVIVFIGGKIYSFLEFLCT